MNFFFAIIYSFSSRSCWKFRYCFFFSLFCSVHILLTSFENKNFCKNYYCHFSDCYLWQLLFWMRLPIASLPFQSRFKLKVGRDYNIKLPLEPTISLYRWEMRCKVLRLWTWKSNRQSYWQDCSESLARWLANDGKIKIQMFWIECEIIHLFNN